MMAEDIIAANPHLTFKPQKIGNFNGLAYRDENGDEQWVKWMGEKTVVAKGPWTKQQMNVATDNLAGAQPGREFPTVAADSYARAMRSAGFKVVKDENGEPRSLSIGEAA